MVLPKKFKILGREWRTVIAPGVLRDHLGQMIDGLCDPKNNLIFVRGQSDYTMEYYQATWFHEFFHACLYEQGMFTTDGWDRDFEELVVENFGRILSESFDIQLKNITKANSIDYKMIQAAVANKTPLNLPGKARASAFTCLKGAVQEEE